MINGLMVLLSSEHRTRRAYRRAVQRLINTAQTLCADDGHDRKTPGLVNERRAIIRAIEGFLVDAHTHCPDYPTWVWRKRPLLHHLLDLRDPSVIAPLIGVCDPSVVDRDGRTALERAVAWDDDRFILPLRTPIAQ